jgi:hypothetical protein
MRKIHLILIILTLTVIHSTSPDSACVFSHHANQNRGIDIEAQRKWKGFYRKFLSAVRRRDKVTLRKMMVSDFLLNSSYQENSRDYRSTAFQLLTENRNRGWRRLDRILAKGVGYAKGYRTYGGEEYLDRPHYVSPSNSLSESYDGWSAVFAYGKDKKWHWVGFLMFGE